jgi:hypothetical protein
VKKRIKIKIQDGNKGEIVIKLGLIKIGIKQMFEKCEKIDEI